MTEPERMTNPCRRRPHLDSRRRWRSAAAPVAALVYIAAAASGGVQAADATKAAAEAGSSGRSRTAAPGTRLLMEQHAQWKTKRKQIISRALFEKGEWEDDDDEAPFHLADDDATAETSTVAPAKIKGADGKKSSEKKKDAADVAKGNENQGSGKEASSANVKGEQSNKGGEGIVYSDNIGSKEADPPLPPKKPQPPPPPLPSAEDTNGDTNDVISDDVEGTDEKGVDGAQVGKTANGSKDVHSSTIQTADTTQTNEDDDTPADTILDDLLRGFTFAAAFCLCLVCLHKCCWYSCVRLGVFPDERVMEARWRRWQLKKKRTYRNASNGSPDRNVPPLDTRQWGQWMADRDDADGDDGYYYSANQSGGGVWDDEDDSLAGSIDFEGGLVEMPELEYGEGDELEDKSHDSRLFDIEDGGVGVEREATRFFGRRVGRGPAHKGKKTTDGEDVKVRRDSTGSGISSVASSQNTPMAEAADNESNASEDAFFDALQRPAEMTEMAETDGALPSGSRHDDDPVKNAAMGPPGDVDLLGDSHINAEENAGVDGEEDLNDEEEFGSSILVEEDRGYDVETDLLGLRSDSPPPLDLAEIEKGLVEQMEQAKFH